MMGYTMTVHIRIRDLPLRPIGDMAGVRPPDLETVREWLDRAGFDPYLNSDPRGYGDIDLRGPLLSIHGKWYDHEEDLQALSLAFPSATFHVLGVGEEVEYGDIWTQTFHAGTKTKKRYWLDTILEGSMDLS